MKSLSELKTICEDFQERLEIPFSKDDPDACLERMTELEVIMARSGQYLADAKYWQDESRGKLKQYIDELGSKYSVSTLNEYVKAKTLEENHICNWMERINKACSHLTDNLRTTISYKKEELRQLNYLT